MSSEKETRAESVEKRHDEQPDPSGNENDEVWYDAVEEQSEIYAALTTRSSSWFPLVPAVILEILVDLVNRNDKKSLIRLASCDKFLQNLIYREFSFLWKTIDLQQLHGINDAQLHALLERVNAKYVTKSISLDRSEGRMLLSGVGLMPLTNSRVLESADLRQHDPVASMGPTGLEDMAVADIFRTMLNNKLTAVKVRPLFSPNTADVPFGEYSFAWGEILTALYMKKCRQILNDHVPCSHCGVVLAQLNPDTEIVMRRATSTSIQCTECKKISCEAWDDTEMSSCPAIEICKWCLDAYCPCHPLRHCSRDDCGEKSCADCGFVLECHKCQEKECRHCHDDGPFVLFPCDRCRNFFCEGCEFLDHCYMCDDWTCEECADGSTCEGCGEYWCKSCLDSSVGLLSCDECGKIAGCCVDREDLVDCYDCLCGIQGSVLCKPCCQAHECPPPGILVYSARAAVDGDHQKSLCNCGKRHLTEPKGQQFMCKKRTAA